MQTAPQIEGLEALSPQDQQGVGAALAAVLGSYQARDADAADGWYADDADWVNAFGSHKVGNAEIIPYLRSLFADANFDAGEVHEPPRLWLRPLAPGSVAVWMHVRIRGQRLLDGGAIDVRDNTSMRVLVRGEDSAWRVVAELLSDANTTASFAGHS